MKLQRLMELAGIDNNNILTESQLNLDDKDIKQQIDILGLEKGRYWNDYDLNDKINQTLEGLAGGYGNVTTFTRNKITISSTEERKIWRNIVKEFDTNLKKLQQKDTEMGEIFKKVRIK